jgi:hypothetical protein
MRHSGGTRNGQILPDIFHTIPNLSHLIPRLPNTAGGIRFALPFTATMNGTIPWLVSGWLQLTTYPALHHPESGLVEALTQKSCS